MYSPDVAVPAVSCSGFAAYLCFMTTAALLGRQAAVEPWPRWVTIYNCTQYRLYNKHYLPLDIHEVIDVCSNISIYQNTDISKSFTLKVSRQT